ncbi:MAG: nucleotidyltransferase family protein [Thermoanaerobaculia bacterium]
MDALPQIVTEHLDEVRALCEKYSVRKLTIFGSAVKGTFDPEKSDLDFVVEFLPDTKRSGFDDPYFSLLIALQDVFGREVDLVERQAIRNPYFVKVLALTERALYESARAA